MSSGMTRSGAERGQALTELLIAMPVIATFFVAIFYFGYGMNQKIENTMAVHHAAFVYGTDRGRDPDDLHSPVTAADLKSQFMTRNRNISVDASNWNTTRLQWAAYVTDSFSGSRRFWPGGIWNRIKWLPNDTVGIYLAFTGQPIGAQVTTRTTIDASGLGYRIPYVNFNPSNKTVEASLFVDQKTRKLETVSLNLDPNNPFDPGAWDFGYLPAMFAYMGWGLPLIGWDWDFGMNCMSRFLLQFPQQFDTEWVCP
jgi:hypothetical protein